MKRPPAITEAEWEIMSILWTCPDPVPANDVVAALQGRKSWNPRTTKTLLNRLVKKRALGFEQDGKRYLYHPLVRREDCVRAESRSFLSRFFANQPGEMLCRFVDEVDLTPDEIKRLKQILDRKGK